MYTNLAHTLQQQHQQILFIETHFNFCYKICTGYIHYLYFLLYFVYILYVGKNMLYTFCTLKNIIFEIFLWWLYDKNRTFCVVDGFAKRKTATITSNLYVFCICFCTFCIQETYFVYILYIHHVYKLGTHNSIIVTKFVQDTYIICTSCLYFVYILYVDKNMVYTFCTLKNIIFEIFCDGYMTKTDHFV